MSLRNALQLRWLSIHITYITDTVRQLLNYACFYHFFNDFRNARTSQMSSSSQILSSLCQHKTVSCLISLYVTNSCSQLTGKLCSSCLQRSMRINLSSLHKALCEIIDKCYFGSYCYQYSMKDTLLSIWRSY